LPPAADFGAVTALQPTPALSLLAIAYESGPVTLHNIRADKEVMRLNTGGSQKLPVTSISFRTDGLGAGEEGREDGVMATASKESGDITFWDLNNARWVLCVGHMVLLHPPVVAWVAVSAKLSSSLVRQ
jgi:U3 small nucleolar RNA-associated protein 21